MQEYRDKLDELDCQMAILFEERMETVKKIAEYKKKNSIPITDSNRENEVVLKNCKHIKDKSIVPYYNKFIKNVISLSKELQNEELLWK
ncbi:MAG: chorismate mutase [Oscillospiraceae bacterium]